MGRDHGQQSSAHPGHRAGAAEQPRAQTGSEAYRRAREALLVEEIELRRELGRVVKRRRALPPGGKLIEGYRFDREHGPVRFADLLSAWGGQARHIAQRSAQAAIARSPIGGLLAYRQERGWRDLALYADAEGDDARDWVSAEDPDMPAINDFSRRYGTIRHFWS